MALEDVQATFEHAQALHEARGLFARKLGFFGKRDAGALLRISLVRTGVPGRFAVELKPHGPHAETTVVRLLAMAERSGLEAALRQCGGCEHWFRADLVERLRQLGLDAVELERRSDARHREEIGG